jgi:tartrate-resistant acid phosphatase type 5
VRLRTSVVLLWMVVLIQCRGGGRGPTPPTPPPTPTPVTPPAGELRFFALGDTGTASAEQFQVGRTIAAHCRAHGCDLGVLLGDNFYPDGVGAADDPQWQSKFEEPYAELLASGIRFHAVLGNHDYADAADQSRAAQQVARSAVDPRFVMPAAHYRFERGPARFAALDTQMLALRDDGHAAQERIVADAAAHSAGTPRPWLVALGHHPYRSNGPNGNAGPRLARFLEDVVCRQADLYLAGHDHNLQVLTAPGCDALLVVSGGGGYATYPVGNQQPSLFQVQAHGFAYVTLSANRLIVEMIDSAGRVLFRHERAR